MWRVVLDMLLGLMTVSFWYLNYIEYCNGFFSVISATKVHMLSDSANWCWLDTEWVDQVIFFLKVDVLFRSL